MKKLGLFSLFFVLVMISGCGQDKWEGYVYPDKNDLNKHIFVGEFQSLEACREAATSKLQQLGATNGGDYECGKNCRSKSGLSVRVCEETSK